VKRTRTTGFYPASHSVWGANTTPYRVRRTGTWRRTLFALHERLGFQLIGTFGEVGYKHGEYRDVSWFEKNVSAPTPDTSVDA